MTGRPLAGNTSVQRLSFASTISVQLKPRTIPLYNLKIITSRLRYFLNFITISVIDGINLE